MNFLSLSRALLLSLATLTASSALIGCGDQPEARSANAHHNTLVVVGTGKVTTKPDVARIQLGIEALAPTVAEATKDNNSQMTKLIEALTSAGIAKTDIQTSNFSINYERHYEPNPIPAAAPVEAPAPKKGAATTAAAPAVPARPVQTGMYRVSNTVQIVVRNLDRVGAVIDAAVASGANNLWGVSFDLEDDAAAQAQLREKAVADAKERAKALAALGGVTLGEVVSISEVVGQGGGSPRLMKDAAYASQSTPVESGELQLQGQIELIYSIEKR